MTNGILKTPYKRSWEEADRGQKVVAVFIEALITAPGALAMTLLPADFGWRFFFHSPAMYDFAGASIQWTTTKDALGNITQLVTATNPAAGDALVCLRGY